MAMCIESIFSGLTLGVMDETSALYGFFLALVLHKWAEALSIGISFAKIDMPKKKAVILGLIFSLAAPIGIIVGIIFDESDGYTKGILMAISAGTFIYIGATEIIVEEFTIKKNKYWKFMFYSLGFAFIVFLFFVEKWLGGHDHGHEEHDDH